MTQFENVTVVKQANIYFDGKVTSRTVLFPSGEKKTLGIMLPGSEEWRAVRGGESFDVPGEAKFQLRVHEVTDYCCSYGK
jgi:purine/pyrimidine-nucleoside phosphorylase